VTGTCVGGTFIDRDIAISGARTGSSRKPLLDGDSSARVIVIKPGVRVSIRDLTILGGKATLDRPGGGISNKGRLTLRDVVVRDNDSFVGTTAGIYNDGAIRMLGGSVVKENWGSPAVLNAGRLVLRDRSRIGPANTEVRNTGHLVIDDAATVVGNGPFGRSGPALLNTGTVTMNDRSSIQHQGGGGIDNDGTVRMNDRSSIHDNVDYFFGSVGRGGGVQNSGTLRLTGESSIHDNRVMAITGYAGQGGGVFNTGSLIMEESSRVYGNGPSADATAQGGGLYNASGGTLLGVTCGPGGNVYGNTPDDCYLE
jgi:hypothetical protein